MGYLFLVLGLAEFLGWFFFGEGLIGGWIYSILNPNYPWLANFVLFKNPFLALYLILPSAWLLQDQIREIVLGRWSFMAHPNLEKISERLVAGCNLALAVLAFIFIIYFIKGWGFDSNFGNFLLFSSVILLIFFEFALTNLPKPQVIRQSFLSQDIKGLYALKHDQFILEEVPGQTEELIPIGRWWKKKKVVFKEKRREWFVFSAGTRPFAEQNKSASIGVLQIDYSWWADVSSAPDKIRTEEIALSGIESTEHLEERLHLDFIHQFREIITTRPKYTAIQREIKKVSSDNIGEFVQDTLAQEIVHFAYSPEEAVNFSSKSFNISLKIKGLCEELLREASAFARGIEAYGGLYIIGFQVNDLSLSREIATEITRFEENAKEQFKEWYSRKQELFKVLLDLTEKLDGRIPREVSGRIIEGLLDMTRESPTQRSALPSPAAFRRDEAFVPESVNIEKILQDLEPTLNQAKDRHFDTGEAIKTIIPDIGIIQNGKKLSVFQKADLFETWLSSNRDKLKSGNAKDILREFIKEQINIGSQIYTM